MVLRAVVGGYESGLLHLPKRFERRVFRLLVLVAFYGEAFTLEDYGEGCRGDAELLDHEILHPLGLRTGAVEPAAL